MLAPEVAARSAAASWTSCGGHSSFGAQIRTSDPMIAPVTSSERPMLNLPSPRKQYAMRSAGRRPPRGPGRRCFQASAVPGPAAVWRLSAGREVGEVLQLGGGEVELLEEVATGQGDAHGCLRFSAPRSLAVRLSHDTASRSI